MVKEEVIDVDDKDVSGQMHLLTVEVDVEEGVVEKVDDDLILQVFENISYSFCICSEVKALSNTFVSKYIILFISP